MLATRKKRLIITAALLIAVFTAILAVQNLGRNEGPVYEKRSLEKWVVEVWEGALASSNEARAELAIKAIGTNGLPYLLTWINHEDSEKKRTARFIINSLLYNLSRMTRGTQKTFEYYETSRAVGATLGLIILQPRDSDTFMKLTNLFKSGGDSTRDRSARVLIYFGEAGASFFAAEMTNGSPSYREDAIYCLRKMHKAARPAIPALIQAVDDQHSDIQVAAVRALGGLRLEPDLSVPALNRKLQSSNYWIQSAAAQALGNFGTNANSSVPLLIKAIEQPTPLTRMEALTNALYQISPLDYTNVLNK